MTDSAQDYTYQVLSVDSSGTAMIQMTSYDSLQYHFWYELEAGDSDGTIANLVKGEENNALFRWSEERQVGPSITIGTPVTERYKVRTSDGKPQINLLTKRLESYDSETADEIITHYSVRNLTDSEKAEVYDNLSLSRSSLWMNLIEAGVSDSVAQILQIDDYVADSSEVQFRHSSDLRFYDTGPQEVKSALGFNDSDFAILFSVK